MSFICLKDPTTSPSVDLIPTIRGSEVHPGRATQGGLLCVFWRDINF
jgi:hypothetical protein